MKQIRIESNELTTVVMNRKNLPSKKLVFSYLDGEKKSVIFADTEKSKPIDKEVFLEKWNSLMNLNFTKILSENEGNIGLDGFNVKIYMENGMNRISVSLWCPNEEFYKKTGALQSAELTAIINSIVTLANNNGVKVKI